CNSATTCTPCFSDCRVRFQVSTPRSEIGETAAVGCWPTKTLWTRSWTAWSKRMAGDTHGEHEKELWLERIIQLLHDPPGKVKYLARHKRLSQELAETITGLNWTEEEWKQALVNRPDAIMAGADRPCLTWATRQHFNTVTRQRVTHPLSRSDEVPPLLLADSTAQPPVGKASGVEEREQQREAARRLVTTELATGGDYEGAFYRVWRRFR